MNKTIFSSLASIILLCACGTEKQRALQTETFPVTSPLVIDTVYYSDYVAEIHSRQNIEIRARVKGYLEKTNVDEGAHVKDGEVLFVISSQEYREELLKAQAVLKSTIAEMKTAELDVQNVTTLLNKNIVSKTELAIAKAKLEALQAKTEEMRAYESSARLRLAYTEVKAPFNGIIDRIPNKTGSLVDEGELLTTLSDNTEIYAYFNVSEKEYLAYTANQSPTQVQNTVSLLLADNSLHPYKGVIETIEGEFNHGTGSIAFRARFANPMGILRHGASGKVRLRRHIRQALVIPQKSTFEIQDKMYVFIVDKNNQVKMHSIVPKLRLPHLFVVASGLSSNDRIIYEGIQDVSEGLKIKPELVDMRSIMPLLATSNK